MGADEVVRLLRQQPFRPFRLRLSNDATYEIRHPDLAIATPSAVYVGLPKADAPVPVAEDIVIVSLMHVRQLEFLTPSPAAN